MATQQPHETEFFLNDIESELKFVLDERGKASQVVVYQAAKDSVAARF